MPYVKRMNNEEFDHCKDQQSPGRTLATDESFAYKRVLETKIPKFCTQKKC